MKYRKIDDLHSHGQQIFGLKPLFDSPDNMNEKLLELAELAGAVIDKEPFLETTQIYFGSKEDLTKFTELVQANSAPDGWIDVNDELPDLSQLAVKTIEVLVCVKLTDKQIYKIVDYCKRINNKEAGFEYSFAEYITHWKPLTPPKSADKKD